jgi:trehalose/maltose hydrolase-like predicted phosphorylase
MSAMAAPAPHGAGPDVAELDDAREALAYWETRATALPRRAIRDRREAREMALRWRGRVTEAERAAYGRGLRGALLLMAAELRLPESTRHAGRHVARRARQATVAVAVTVLAVLVAMAVALVAVASAVLHALA